MKKIFTVIVFIAFLMGTINANPLWMRYPSISPDGSKVVFSYKGDLFVVSSNGGKAFQLTNHEAHDYMPVWSADSKQIVFASDRFGNFDLYRINAEGGVPERLTFHSAGEYPQSITTDGTILFKSTIEDSHKNAQFPSGLLSELYAVSINGGAISRVLTTPAENAVFTNDKSKLYYHDIKGYEDPWRKHHTSSVTRDIWVYDVNTGEHKKLSGYDGEDRNPVVASNQSDIFYLSEQFGSFNVVKMKAANPDNVEQITSFDMHPVRFLSISDNDKLCFSYHGEIYTKEAGDEPKKLAIELSIDDKWNNISFEKEGSGATDFAVSPNGKEVAIIIRGEVFVTSTEYNTTKRITNTPEQERSVSFSPDGKKILYASERNGSWNLYETKLAREEEKYFSNATILKEEPLLVTDKETFQPKYSPDGKEVAFLEERTTLRILNLETKATRTVLEGKYNYSYSDGDQWFDWSPDSKWLLAEYLPHERWVTEVGLIDASGLKAPVNLTKSGYSDNRPKWMMDGEMLIWFSDKMGYRSHGSWGAHDDVFAMFLTQDAYDKFNLSKEEYELKKELEKKEDKEDDNDDDKKSKKGKSEDKDEEKEVKPIKLELKNIDDRIERLTINSSSLGDAAVTKDGDKLYYLSRFEEGHDLWVKDLRKDETKLLHKLKGYGGGFQFDKKGENLFFISGGKIVKLEVKGDKKENVSYSAEFNINFPGEREYIFEHAWRQVLKKFYDPEIHGLDWEMLKKEYEVFLPHINNNYDFSEMLSELLGELNGSHTGCRYRPRGVEGDATASLGIFMNWDYTGKGIKIDEIIDKGPFTIADTKAKPGTIIEKINGVEIENNTHYFQLLNRKADEKILVSLYDQSTGNRWDETLKPISGGKVNGLLYDRWVEWMNAETERISGGKIGYVHVRGMNSSSFREVYQDLLGKHIDKEAVVVDTRFNGGGWLHDDLATLLSGERYADFAPRGQYVGSEPQNKWYKPSVVLMGEGNYSDAHGFPYAYKTLGIGKLVGMPVPGTMTAVWWESQIDRSLVFGIPQMGVKDMNGNYLENSQLNPDVKVDQDPAIVITGKDQQLEKAIQILIDELD